MIFVNRPKKYSTYYSVKIQPIFFSTINVSSFSTYIFMIFRKVNIIRLIKKQVKLLDCKNPRGKFKICVFVYMKEINCKQLSRPRKQ